MHRQGRGHSLLFCLPTASPLPPTPACLPPALACLPPALPSTWPRSAFQEAAFVLTIGWTAICLLLSNFIIRFADMQQSWVAGLRCALRPRKLA
jgi:hypothetical protein